MGPKKNRKSVYKFTDLSETFFLLVEGDIILEINGTQSWTAT